MGAVGSSSHRGIALIGPSVNIGARLLKHAPLGAIIASGEVFEELRRDVPQLAGEFHPLDAAFIVPGADGMTVATYVVPPPAPVEATSEPFSCSPAKSGSEGPNEKMDGRAPRRARHRGPRLSCLATGRRGSATGGLWGAGGPAAAYPVLGGLPARGLRALRWLSDAGMAVGLDSHRRAFAPSSIGREVWGKPVRRRGLGLPDPISMSALAGEHASPVNGRLRNAGRLRPGRA